MDGGTGRVHLNEPSSNDVERGVQADDGTEWFLLGENLVLTW
jgi:hypothetical protein